MACLISTHKIKKIGNGVDVAGLLVWHFAQSHSAIVYLEFSETLIVFLFLPRVPFVISYFLHIVLVPFWEVQIHF